MPHDQYEGLVNLEIPGLLIEHTKSTHDHLPCVFESSSSEDEEEIMQVESHFSKECELTSPAQSSYEILVIPSRTGSSKSCDEIPKTTKSVTLIHVIDDVPVLISPVGMEHVNEESDSVLAEDVSMINIVAKTLVQKSFGVAAKSLGYHADDIYQKLGIYLEPDGSVRLTDSCVSKSATIVASENDAIISGEITTDVNSERGNVSSENASKIASDIAPSVSVTIINHAKQIVELSMVAAATSLGYRSSEIAEVFGIEHNHESVIDISKSYDQCIKDITIEAVFQAAVSLGYSEHQAHNAIHHIVPVSPCASLKSTVISLKPSQEGITDKVRSITNIGRELAKSAIEEAARNLGITDSELGVAYITEVEVRQLSASTKPSSHSLLATTSNREDEPNVVIAHNALRHAALSLGYSLAEVNEKIGYEKVYRDIEKVKKWVKDLTENLPCNDTFDKMSAMDSVAEWAKNANANVFVDDMNKGTVDPEQISSSPLEVPKPLTPAESLSQVCEPSAEPSSESSSESLVILEQSRALAEDAIQKAVLDLSRRFELPKTDTSTGNKENTFREEEDTVKLKNIAQDLVSGVISKAVDILKIEKEKEFARSEEKRLESLALKLSMLVIGSVGRACGHNDVQIIRGLDKDRQGRYKRERENMLRNYENKRNKTYSEREYEDVDSRKTRRPSMLKSTCSAEQTTESMLKSKTTEERRRSSLPSIVKFNESSIAEARRTSLTLPQCRKDSLRERPLTPKPRDSSQRIVGDMEDIAFTETNMNDHNIQVEKKQRKRKQTPYLTASTQQQIMDEYNSEVLSGVSSRGETWQGEEKNEICEQHENISTPKISPYFSSSSIASNIIEENEEDDPIDNVVYPDAFESDKYISENQVDQTSNTNIKAPLKMRKITPYHVPATHKKIIAEMKNNGSLPMDLMEEGNEIGEDNEQPKKLHLEEHTEKADGVTSQSKSSVARRRKVTPYHPPSIQMNLVREFEKAKENNSEFYNLNEENEEEEDVDQFGKVDEHLGEETTYVYTSPTEDLRTNLDENWSTEFLKKLESATGISEDVTAVKDFSELPETNIIAKVQEEVKKDKAILEELNEYPTEIEFLCLNKKESVENMKPRFQDISETEELSPALLDLYNSIQNDIGTLLSENEMEINGPDSLIEEKPFSEITTTSPPTEFYQSRDVDGCEGDDENQYFQEEEMNDTTKSAGSGIYSCFLPKIDTSSHVFLTGNLESNTSLNSAKSKSSNYEIVLPSISSDLTSKQPCNITPKHSLSKDFPLPELPVELLPSPTSDLPRISSSQIGKLPLLSKCTSVLHNQLENNISDLPASVDVLENNIESIVSTHSLSNQRTNNSSQTSGEVVEEKVKIQSDNRSCNEKDELGSNSVTHNLPTNVNSSKPDVISSSGSSIGKKLSQVTKKPNIKDYNESIGTPKSTLSGNVTPHYAIALKRDSEKNCVDSDDQISGSYNTHSVSSITGKNRSANDITSIVSENNPRCTSLIRSEAEPSSSNKISSNHNVPSASNTSIKNLRKESDNIKRSTKDVTSTDNVTPHYATPVRSKSDANKSSSSIKDQSSKSDVMKGSISQDVTSRLYNFDKLKAQAKSSNDTITKKHSNHIKNKKCSSTSVAKELRGNTLSRSSKCSSLDISIRNSMKNISSEKSGSLPHISKSPQFSRSSKGNSKISSGNVNLNDKLSSVTHTKSDSPSQNGGKKIKKQSLSQPLVKESRKHSLEDCEEIDDLRRRYVDRNIEDNGVKVDDSIEKLSVTPRTSHISEVYEVNSSSARSGESLGGSQNIIQKTSSKTNSGELQACDEFKIDENTLITNSEESQCGSEIKIPEKKSVIKSASSKPSVNASKVSTVNLSLSDNLNALKALPVAKYSADLNSQPKLQSSIDISNVPTSRSTASRKNFSNMESNGTERDVRSLSKVGSTTRVSSVLKYVPSPPISNKPSRMICSQSLNFITNRSMRAVARSKSLGSDRRVLSNSPRNRFHSQSNREMIPMIGEGEFKDFNELNSSSPMVNDVRSVKSIAKSTSATMWHPTQSVVDISSNTDLKCPSSTAVMVQPALPSRNVSASSFHSGPIVVAPVESINFVASTHSANLIDITSDSLKSMDEVVQKHISGTDITDRNRKSP